MDNTSSGPSTAATPYRIGQACDRCRRKKIKCDGAFPTCRRCEKGGWKCESSDVLQRKTKIRGFASDEHWLEQLRTELLKCQQQLEVEKSRNATLQENISRQGQTSIPLQADSLALISTEPRVGSLPREHYDNDPTYVIRHMGRMVHDENGVGRFAGTTTGVHFVLSVERECQNVLNLPNGFPESCFRLFLAQPCPDAREMASSLLQDHQKNISSCLTFWSSYYCEQVDLFIRNWESLCPVLPRNQIITDIRKMIDSLRSQSSSEELNSATALSLLMIICINRFCRDHDQHTLNPDYELHLSLAGGMVDKVAAKGDLRSLQALVLFAFYHQLGGHCLEMARINGLMVSVAQSLGLHRHARRFKMRVGEVEQRKRLWWWVYAFDRIAPLLHGLPSLINDVDVDAEMPMDCQLYELNTDELSYPLPGEKSAVFAFIQYVLLAKIFSRIRGMLYTTTQRRNGVAKIRELDLDLRMWNQNLKLNGIHFEIGTVPTQAVSEEHPPNSDQTLLHLQLLGNVAMILIHRPGLTFDNGTPEFSACLRACEASSSVNLTLLENPRTSWWLQNISLMGPGMVFQSALTHVYSQCRYISLNQQRGLSSESTNSDMILSGMAILQRVISNESLSYSNEHLYFKDVSEALEVLRMLRVLLIQRAQIHESNDEILDEHMMHYMPGNLTDTTINTNALDVLNYVTATDWMYEVPEPFMGFMDVGGLNVGPKSPLGPG